MTPVRIALVDDDLSVRRALPRLLRSAGYEVRAFSSAQELLDSGFAGLATCFVLDIHLERESGFDVLDQLRDQGATAPAIFITAFDSADHRERAGRTGASAFLRKPFDGGDLLDAIASAARVPCAENGR
jgi:FixJ family two-component response regulator